MRYINMMANEKRYTEWLTGVKHLVYDSIRHLGQLILEGMDADMALEAMKAGNVNLEGGIGLGGAEKNLTWLPLISFVQAGGWCAVVDNLQPGDAEDWVPYPGRIGPHAFALRVNGPTFFGWGGLYSLSGKRPYRIIYATRLARSGVCRANFDSNISRLAFSQSPTAALPKVRLKPNSPPVPI